VMIRPIASTRIPGAEHIQIAAPLHSLLVFDRRLYADIAQKLMSLRVRNAA
jgi:hypothetical protein